MSTRFLDLLFSSKHEFTQNPESKSNWPEIYFWTKGLMLLNWVQGVLARLPSLEAKIQQSFWQGSMPPQFLNDFPWLPGFSAQQVVEYCQIRQSADAARTRLIIRACAYGENPKDQDSEVSFGKLWLNEKK